eukprot:m.76178 g.76178  ORF g.76178 m.76178 type:complete len:176 (-) comp8508_c0_seq2:545-1072(-)
MMSEDEHHHELSYPSPPSSMTQAQHQHSNENPIMLRIFAEHAIYSPGVEYKTVPATNSTTALEVIQMVLNKFGEMEPASKFELKYVRINSKTGRVKRRNSLLKLVKGDSDFSIVRLSINQYPLPFLLVFNSFFSHRHRFLYFNVFKKSRCRFSNMCISHFHPNPPFYFILFFCSH